MSIFWSKSALVARGWKFCNGERISKEINKVRLVSLAERCKAATESTGGVPHWGGARADQSLDNGMC